MSGETKIDDGGPAFPHPVNKHAVGMQYAIVDGMSLRDWFAGQAIAGWIACYTTNGDPDVGSKYAYDIADAMLAARTKTPG